MKELETINTLIILGSIVQVVLLIVFFVMASNVSKIKKFAKIQMDHTLFDSEYYLNLMKEVNKIEVPQHQKFQVDEDTCHILFTAGEERTAIYRELGRYSCFFGEKEVYFRTQEDAIKGLYLFQSKSK